MESMDAKFWLDALQWLLTALLALWVHLSNRHRVTQERMQALANALDEKLDDHDRRLVRLQTEMESLPNSREFRAMEGDIRSMRSTLEGIQNSLAPLVRNLERINDYLLNRKS